MHVSQAIVDRLLANGVTVMFGIPGTQTLPLNEAIEQQDGIRYVMARHETAVSHQAWGYAETSDGMAAVLVVPGPGDMNAMNGLKNALNDTTPLLHLTVETEPELRGGDAIHETPPDTYDNVLKENLLANSPASTPAVIERAIAAARTPPQGPVRVGIPRNFLSKEVGEIETADVDRRRPGAVSAAALERTASLLSAAEAPMVVAGGGIRRSEATEPLRRVAELLDAPVTTTLKGKGTFPENHALSAGALTSWDPRIESLVERSDLVLAVGTDLDAVTTGNWSVPLPDRLIHVTLDPNDLGRGYEPTIGLLADAGEFLAGVLERASPEVANERDGEAGAAAVRQGRAERLAALRDEKRRLTSPGLCAAARDAIPRDAVVTADGGGLRIWMNEAFTAYPEGWYVQPGSWATMGTALPSAIGAALAEGDQPVVAIVGDGGLMMSIHELHTVVVESLPVTTLVANNDGYAIISEAAAREFEMETGAYDWESGPVEFTRVAAGLGMAAVRVDSAAGVREALDDALTAAEPRLIEVMTAPHEPQAFHWMAGD